MKNIILTVLISFILGNITAQDNEADAIRGIWFTQDQDAKIKIFRATDGKYYGKIIWMENPNNADGSPKLDTENNNPKLAAKPILGLLLIKGFSYDSNDNEWNNGTIYDPNNGTEYKCYMWFSDADPNKLHVKGFVGISLLGREVEWTRVSE